MITRHHADSVTLFDGEREHRIKHSAFVRGKPHKNGGIHPAVTEDWHMHLAVSEDVDMSACPLKPVPHVLIDLHGVKRTEHYIPIEAWLQAEYGPGKQIVSVPINGDANAQRLHWLHRNEKERAEMKSLLQYLGAWRLTDEGEVP